MGVNLIRSTSLFTLANVLPQAANFLLLPLYTAYLDTEGYGLVNTVLVLSGVLAIIFTLGTERSIFRLFYDHPEGEKRKEFLGIVFSLLLLTSTATGVVVVVLGLSGYSPFSSIPFYPLIFLVVLTEWLNVFGHLPKIVYQVGQKTVRFVSVSLLQFIVNNLFILWFVVGRDMGAYGMLLGYLMGSLVLLPFFLLEVRRMVRLSLKKQIVKDIYAFSLPMIPALAAAWIMNLTDRWILERYVSMDEIGIFSLGAKIGSLLLIVNSAFFRAYNPFFYQVANERSGVEARQILYETNRFFLMVLLFGSFLLAFFAPELVEIVFPKDFARSGQVIPFFTMAYFVSGIHGLLNLFLYQMKRTKEVSLVLLIGALVSLGLNLLLIPFLGMMGAAVSVLAANLTIVAIEYRLAQKAYFVPFDWKNLTLAIGVVVVLLVCFPWIPLTPWSMLFSKAVLLTLILGITWRFKGAQIKGLFQRIKLGH